MLQFDSALAPSGHGCARGGTEGRRWSGCRMLDVDNRHRADAGLVKAYRPA
jgi:hypothetical protein